jgi:diguanylate cyclase (GGDEF)-like protein
MRMEAGENSQSGHHVAGLYTQMLMKPLMEELSEEAVRDLLRRAGEDRSPDELCDTSSWSSFDQFRSLLQEVKRSLESISPRREMGLRSVLIGNIELVETAQAFGSPASLFIEGGADNPLLPIRQYETTEIGPNEWAIRERFVDGFEPFPEYCEFTTGLLAVIPMVFGLPAGEVIEEECQCRGDPACLFRLSWESADETSRIEFLEMRTQLLEARLRQVHDMIEDLATNERYEDVLRGIVGSSLRAVGAAGCLLVIKPRASTPQRIYAQGLTQTEASSLAEAVLGGSTPSDAVVVIEVASARHTYGVLAVDGQGGVLAKHSRDTLMTYARLAAAALDSADALESARHEANTAQALLTLSSSLAHIKNMDEMVAQVVQAVPDVIDCDRVALFMHSDGPGTEADRELKLIASSGYPDEAVAVLRSITVAASGSAGAADDQGIARTVPLHVGTVAAISAPIRSPDRVVGYIVVGVTSGPDRLVITPQLTERLEGLAAQASIAISNSVLVDKIRFQAVHDALTGLPNRSLILDRTEQALARSTRRFERVAVLFIDLDGFKTINDTLGHGAGDELLKAVANRLAGSMRTSDSVGRLGGDEFVVLIDGDLTDEGPELVAERLLASLRSPFEIDGVVCPLNVTASVGIAVGTRPSANELLRDADLALYRAKAAGKDRFVVFRPEMHTAVPDHHQPELGLLDAV